MATPTVFLYKAPLVINLVQTNNNVGNVNMSYVDRDFLLWKGAQTDIEFMVRNNDRKPVNIVGKNVYITILDTQSKRMILEKELIVIDEYKGKIKLSITPNESANWSPGFYDYSILIENEDGTKNFLYVDQNQNAKGWFEVKDGIAPLPAPSMVSETASWKPDHTGLIYSGVTWYVSDYYPGASKLGGDEGLHTIAVYLNNFTGKFKVQGSLDDMPPTVDSDWFDIHLTPNTFELIYLQKTGVEAYNFRANVMWVRFIMEPDQLNNNGTITKVILKT